MLLVEAIANSGMKPPKHLVPGKWLRFPGVGKGLSNRSGWCRVITPTLAIFGDWSSGIREVWKDDSHLDDERSMQALRDAQARERRFCAEQRATQNRVAHEAQEMIFRAVPGPHPYLARKGFPALQGLTIDGKLLIPVMDFDRYPAVISAQLIDAEGEKKFLTGGRAKGGVHRLGAPPARARRLALCEGYATGLSLEAALRMLPGAFCVVVCFSANNLEHVCGLLPASMDPLVCADNDRSGVGEASAKRTGKRWIMPPTEGHDYNDMHVSQGLRAVMEAIRCQA